MEFLILTRPAIHEIVVPEACQERDFRRYGFNQRAGLAKKGEPLRQIHVRNAVARNEAALRIEVRRDAIDRVVGAETPAIHNHRTAEQWRRDRRASRVRETRRTLPKEAEDAAHQSPIDTGDAIPFSAINLIGVHQADATRRADVMLQTQHVEDWRMLAVEARILIVHRRQKSDVEAVHFSGELRRRHRLRDAPRVDQATWRRELFLALKEERPALGEKVLHPRIVGELRSVSFHLRKVGVRGAGQRQVAGDAPACAAADFRMPGVVCPLGAVSRADRCGRDRRNQIHRQTTRQIMQTNQMS